MLISQTDFQKFYDITLLKLAHMSKYKFVFIATLNLFQQRGGKYLPNSF
jgi:hypothetical protein